MGNRLLTGKPSLYVTGLLSALPAVHDLAFYPMWDGEMSISLHPEYDNIW